jgi:hypothetical protein
MMNTWLYPDLAQAKYQELLNQAEHQRFLRELQQNRPRPELQRMLLWLGELLIAAGQKTKGCAQTDFQQI